MSGSNVAPEIARLKGEINAVRRVGIKKNCTNLPPEPAAPEETPSKPTNATATAAAPAAAQPSAAGGNASAAPATAPAVAANQWHGEGPRDACGKPYHFDIAIDGDRYVKGILERDGVSYVVNGKADPGGKLDNSLADLSDPAAAATAPKHLTVDLQFGPEYTTGGFSTFDGAKFDCTTAVTLTRT
jgi:hypothetical protein